MHNSFSDMFNQIHASNSLKQSTLQKVYQSAAYNTDGAFVLDTLALKGIPYTEAISQIMNSTAMESPIVLPIILILIIHNVLHVLFFKKHLPMDFLLENILLSTN